MEVSSPSSVTLSAARIRANERFREWAAQRAEHEQFMADIKSGKVELIEVKSAMRAVDPSKVPTTRGSWKPSAEMLASRRSVTEDNRSYNAANIQQVDAARLPGLISRFAEMIADRKFDGVHFFSGNGRVATTSPEQYLEWLKEAHGNFELGKSRTA